MSPVVRASIRMVNRDIIPSHWGKYSMAPTLLFRSLGGDISPLSGWSKRSLPISSLP